MTRQASKQTVLISALLLPAALTSAQSNSASNSNFYEGIFGTLAIVGGLIVLVGAIYTILRMFGMLVKIEEIRMLKEKGLDEVAAHYEKPEKPMLARVWSKLQGTVPITQEKDILFDHEYDGIRELDNSLPPWWLGMFYISIVIAGVYFYVYHISGTGLSSKEKYELEMENAQIDVDAYLATQADQIDESSAELLTGEDDLTAGESIYTMLCVVCHGTLGEGGVGPNFTDEYWIHGGDIKDLFRTIKYGVPEKGMISWTSQLRPSEMQQVGSYILQFQGTDPPNQKDPQGELYVPPPPTEAMLQDTTEAIE